MIYCDCSYLILWTICDSPWNSIEILFYYWNIACLLHIFFIYYYFMYKAIFHLQSVASVVHTYKYN